MTSKDFTTIPHTNANEIQENITTHNILVVTMISHYIKEYARVNSQVPHENPKEAAENSKFHRTFSMLVLHLIECPDLTFEELNNLISCGKYQLPQYFIRTYHLEVHRLVNSDLDATMDMFKNLEGSSTSEDNLLDAGLPKVRPKKIINSCSPIGVFLRRIMVFFDKMLFLQTAAVMKEVKNHCNPVLNELPVRKIKPNLIIFLYYFMIFLKILIFYRDSKITELY